MIRALAMAVGFSLAAFVFRRVIPEIRAHRDTRRMTSDQQGNYDMDGVSYDSSCLQVVVTGDGRAPDPVRALN